MPLNRLADSGQGFGTAPDIQTTTFSIDAIARFVCNTWDEIVAAEKGGQFDVVVVGSGMYGAYCATKIFEFTQNFGAFSRRQKPRQSGSPVVMVIRKIYTS